MAKSFTKEEEILIIKLFQEEKKTGKEIVEILKEKLNSDRTISSIRHFVQRRGITRYNSSKPFTDEEKQQILELYHQKKRSKEIADILGMNYKRVNEFLHREGFSTPTSIYFKLTQEDIEDICSLYKQGLPACRILEKYNDKVVSENSIIKVVRDNGFEVRPRGTFPNIKNEDFFEIIDTEEKAYILGWLISDGYVIYPKGKKNPFWGITVKSSDKYILERFKEIIGIEKNIVDSKRFRPNRKTKYTYESELVIISRKMVEDLAKYDIVPRKCKTVTFPSNIRDDLIPHIIRGIFDGDGCIGINKSVSFTGNQYVISKIQQILENKINLNKVKLFEKEGTFILSFSAKQNVKDFYHYIYDNATIYLTRKKERFEKLEFIND